MVSLVVCVVMEEDVESTFHRASPSRLTLTRLDATLPYM